MYFLIIFCLLAFLASMPTSVSAIDCLNCTNLRTVNECNRQKTVECKSGLECMQKVDLNVRTGATKVSSQCASECTTDSNVYLCDPAAMQHNVCLKCCQASECGTRFHIDKVIDTKYIYEFTARTPMLFSMATQTTAQKKTLSQDYNTKLHGIMKEHFHGGYSFSFNRYEPRDNSTHRVILDLVVTVMTFRSDKIMKELNAILVGNEHGGLDKIADLRYNPVVTEISDVHPCPESTKDKKNQFTWKETFPGETVRQLCSKKHTPDKYATRICNDLGVWGLVDDRPCLKGGTDKDKDNELLVITKDNSLEISKEVVDFLKKKMHDGGNISESEMEVLIYKLSHLVSETTLVPKVAINVLTSFNYLLEIRQEPLKLPSKFRLMLYEVAEHLPIAYTDLGFQFESDNIAFHCSPIHGGERNITTVEVFKENHIQLNVTFDMPQPNTGPVRLDMSLEYEKSSRSSYNLISSICFWELTNDYLYPKASELIASNDSASDIDFEKYENAGVGARIFVAYIPEIQTRTPLQQNITLTFEHLSKEFIHNPACVHWDKSYWLETPHWEFDGCQLVDTNGTHTVCVCDHMASFTLLMTADGYVPFISIWLVIFSVGLTITIFHVDGFRLSNV